MTQGDALAVMQDAIYTVILAAIPMMLVAIVVGLAVSIFQATTQINEQTLAFVPKIVAIMMAILLFGGYVFSTVEGFTIRMFESIIPRIS